MKNFKYIQKLAELCNEAPVSIALYQQLLTYDQSYFMCPHPTFCTILK